MPTKKTASSTKKKSTVKRKKQTKKTTTSSSKKKTTAKKSSAKKKPAKKTTATKKKAPAKKKKTTTRKKPRAKKSTTKAKAKSKTIVQMETEETKKQMHVFPAKRTLINQLSVVDLDALYKDTQPEEPEKTDPVRISMHSRLAFYLGVFLGAIVVNAFLVTILAVMSV